MLQLFTICSRSIKQQRNNEIYFQRYRGCRSFFFIFVADAFSVFFAILSTFVSLPGRLCRLRRLRGASCVDADQKQRSNDTEKHRSAPKNSSSLPRPGSVVMYNIAGCLRVQFSHSNERPSPGHQHWCAATSPATSKTQSIAIYPKKLRCFHSYTFSFSIFCAYIIEKRIIYLLDTWYMPPMSKTTMHNPQPSPIPVAQSCVNDVPIECVCRNEMKCQHYTHIIWRRMVKCCDTPRW